MPSQVKGPCRSNWLRRSQLGQGESPCCILCTITIRCPMFINHPTKGTNSQRAPMAVSRRAAGLCTGKQIALRSDSGRSEEHTSELQSHSDLVCRLLLEKKKHRHDHVFPADPESFILVHAPALAH